MDSMEHQSNKVRHHMHPKTMLMLCVAAAALSPAAVQSMESAPETLVMSNGAIRAEIVPEWGGRLQWLGRPGGANALWTNPAAATLTNAWRNVGGEKTWAGAMSMWIRDGKSNPWFDEGPFEVVASTQTRVLLRAGPSPTKFGDIVLEREFTLMPDRLRLRERLVPQGVPAIPPRSRLKESTATGEAVGEEAAGRDPFEPLPNDPRRVWGVAQIRLVPRVAARMCGGCRKKLYASFPEPGEGAPGSWLELDLASAPMHARITLDADALAAPVADDSGDWLLIEHAAPGRNLEHFDDPSRAIVYTTGPVSEKFPLPYVELEFVALGPDAEQTLDFRITGKPAGLE